MSRALLACAVLVCAACEGLAGYDAERMRAPAQASPVDPETEALPTERRRFVLDPRTPADAGSSDGAP